MPNGASNIIKDMGKSDIIVSLLLIAVCTFLFRILSFLVAIFTEDAAKIMIIYTICDMLEKDDKKYPINVLWIKEPHNNGIQYIIKDSPEKYYKLPTQIDKNYDEILKSSHKVSNIYNQINIRLSDFHFNKEKNLIELSTERTMYFDLLVTNRAMDTIWNNDMTVRNLYEPGPFLHSLKESRLANHIGYNGIIETSDGMIAIVHRGSRVSTDKNQYKFSVSGSLKTRYVLDKGCNTITSIDQICNAVRHEIIDELNITEENREKIVFDKDDIIAFLEMSARVENLISCFIKN